MTGSMRGCCMLRECFGGCGKRYLEECVGGCLGGCFIAYGRKCDVWEDASEEVGEDWVEDVACWEDVWKDVGDNVVEDVVCSWVVLEDAWQDVNGGKGLSTRRWAWA